MITVYRKSPRLAHRVIEGEGFIVDPADQKLHHLNPVAAAIWQQINGKRDEAALAGELREKYDVDRGTASRDVKEFLNVLLREGLVEKVPS